MDQAEVRKATNESLFREVNERIETTARHFGSGGSFEAVCECADVACTDRIELTVAEYEEVRAHPARFVIVPGHEDPEVDRVTAERGAYTLVEKVGNARVVAEAQDPRS
jgi:hypothetical protein